VVTTTDQSKSEGHATKARSDPETPVVSAPGTHPGRRASLGTYVFVLPALVLVVGVIYFAIIYTLRVSVLDWDGLSPDQKYVGMRNYVELIKDPIFWSTLKHMAIFSMTIFIQMALGLLFALILYSRIRFKMIYKVVLFVPVVLSPAVMAPIFRHIFDADGELNGVLHFVGLGSLAHPWLADPRTSLYVVIAINVWQWTGFSFVLYYAALTQIDDTVLEAARIDGATNWRLVRYIVMPLTRGTSLTLIILGIIGVIKTFDVPFLVTGGGPARASEFLSTYLYREGIVDFHVGYGAALTTVLVALSLILTTGQIRRYRMEGSR
jgi:ABC-type sugar transport system permease subunit